MAVRPPPWAPSTPFWKPATRSRGPAILALTVVVVTAAVLPFAQHQVGRSASFLPAQLTAVACCDVLALILLGREFRRSGNPRVLAMSMAYCWSVVVMAGHAASFPGVFSAHPALATAPSVATWLHVLWHVGFPVLVAVAWLPLPARWVAAVPPQRRTRLAAAGQLSTVTVAAIVVGGVVALGHHLPVLVRGDDTSRLTDLTAPVALPLLLAAIVVCWRARHDDSAASWAYVTATVCAADMTALYAAEVRYSVGWYAGRVLTVAGAGVIAAGFLGNLFRAEGALDAEQRLYRNILENLSDGVVLRDAGGRLLLANAAAAPIAALSPLADDGTDRGLANGRTALREDRTEVEATDSPVVRALQQGIPTRDTVFGVPTPEGGTVWISVNASPIRDDDGVVQGVVTSFTDVTARQAAIAELEAARDDALAGTRAKSEFLATVSHEIRTPLNGLLGLNGLLRSTQLTPEQRDYVEAATSCGQALLALVEGVLDLSTIEAGAFRPHSIDLHIPTLVNQAIDTVREPLARQGLQLSVDIDPAIPDVLVGDAARVRQLLSNLLANAVKFTEEGGVAIRVICESGGSVGSETQTGDVLVRFEVTDTGIGIDGADSDRLFEPFLQGDSSNTRRFGGSGLGLSIVRQIARLMGGDAGASGSPGVGSTFWFSTTFTHAAANVDAATDPAGDWSTIAEAPPLQGRLLLAEDNSVNQLVASRILTAWGLDVDTVRDGAAAVAACERTCYDLVLMDCQMPVLDGFDATVKIHALDGAATVPVVALTASTLTDDVRRCAEAGMVGHLTKPLDPHALHRVLSQHLPVASAPPAPAPAVSREVPAPRTRA